MAKKYTIMVIEDEELLLKAIERKLKGIGWEVVACRRGSQAIDYLNHFKQLPDLIWLDYYLPDMSGMDVMHEFKKHKKWAKIPVVVVSNSASDDKVGKMLGLGAKKYLLKAEHRLSEIVEMIQSILEGGVL